MPERSAVRTLGLDPRGMWVGLSTLTVLAAGIAAGSRGFKDYDLALLPYTLGVLFAAFTVAYRYSVWLQRPATRVYWTRGWQLLFRRPEFVKNVLLLARSGRDNLVAQTFIKHRGTMRWVAHFCFAWGSTVAGAVTFPLVFGWLRFGARPSDPSFYQVVVMGWVMTEFHTQSLTRYVMFNLLNASAVLVIFGASRALRRRLRDPEALARQQFGNDIMPLLLLIAISLTGLMLTFSTHLLRGAGYQAISLVHACVVSGTLLYLPFGKFFHIFQRPAQLSVALYRQANAAAPLACRSCGENFAGAMHVADLKQVLAEVDLDWRLQGPVTHYAEVCPRCRRRLFGFTQGVLMGRNGGPSDGFIAEGTKTAGGAEHNEGAAIEPAPYGS